MLAAPAICLLALWQAGASGCAQAAERQEIRVAVLADKGIESAEQEWAYVFDWLNRRMPELSFVLVGLDHPGLRQAVRARSVDLVITNAGNYSELEHSDGVTRLVTLDSPPGLSPARAVGSAVIVRADSPLRELADLPGRHLLAASPDAFCCYQIAARELLLVGVDPERDLGRLEFVGFPIQAIAHAVAQGKAEAGIVKTCLIEQMVARGEIEPGALRVLSPRQITGFPCQTSSRLYPDWPFAALAHTDPGLAKKVTIALLEMPRTPEGRQWSTPAQYDIVDDLFRDLGIGRYATLQEETLAAIANYARGIDRRIAAGRLEAEPLRCGCGEIERQSSRAAQTIEKIRNFARKGGGSVATVALEPLVKEAVDLFRVTCPDANIVLRAKTGLDSGRIRADALEIQQVVLNLLQNAFEAQMARGNPAASIEVALAAESCRYHVAVCDQGSGLDAAYLARLFEPFFTTKPEGLGLGLSLCKGIVESHGGALELRNMASGVCASFWLPKEEGA